MFPGRILHGNPEISAKRDEVERRSVPEIARNRITAMLVSGESAQVG